MDQGPSIPTSLPTVIELPGLETLLAIVVTIIFIWWLVFTIVAGYHLMRFARESWLTVPAIALHLFISAWIFVFATGGLH